MAKAKKQGKPKRNRRNFAKNLKRISNNVKVLKEIKKSK
jgi:hypothetical protein